jgi:hypothetical protein
MNNEQGKHLWYSKALASTVSIPEIVPVTKYTGELLTGQALRFDDSVVGEHYVIKLAPTVYLELFPKLYNVTNDPDMLPRKKGELLPQGTTISITL